MRTIAITGINSYFSRTLLPFLENDPQIEKIIGIDVTPWEGDSKKVVFYHEDVRNRRIRELLKDVHTVFHFAFIVEEIHDKKLTCDVNINGSKNVFEACAGNGVKKLIYSSSIASYGAHPDNPIGITEDYPLVENEDSYYSLHKVKLEKFLAEFAGRNPEMIITIFRPPVIVGPRSMSFFSDLFRIKITMYMKDRAPQFQLLHEDDLGEALYLAKVRDIPGIFNLAADDYSTLRRFYEIAGVKIINISAGVLKTLTNIFFALRLLRASQGWISLLEYPIVVSNEKFKKATGWRPKYSTEAAFRDFLGTFSRGCLPSGVTGLKKPQKIP